MASILWIWILEEKSGRAHTTEVGTMELSHIVGLGSLQVETLGSKLLGVLGLQLARFDSGNEQMSLWVEVPIPLDHVSRELRRSHLLDQPLLIDDVPGGGPYELFGAVRP